LLTMFHLKPVSWWKVLDVVVIVVAISMVLYQLINTQYMLLEPLKHSNMHLLFAFVITFLAILRNTRKRWPLMLLLALLAIVSTGYVALFFDDLKARALFNTSLDLAIGIILIILCLEATRRAFGIVLPAITGIFILYSFFGYLLPGVLKVMPMESGEIVSRLSLALGWSGIYGYILDISANYIFLFMVFAAMITTTGAVGFFTEVGKLVGRKVRAGPALAAVITSGLVGSVSGSAGANVMITGSFTIPAMKKVGYTAEQAGGIESAASTGGPIIPPVMGVVAFVMAGFTGISYSTIIIVAALPALLYILSAAFYTYFQGERMQVTRWEESVDVRELLLRAPLFLMPLLVIVVLFMMDFTPMFVSFWAVVSICVIGLIRKKTRPSLSAFVRGLVNGAELGSKVAVTCATLGIIVTTITMTGVGVKFPMAIADLVGENLILLLLLTGVISIILGMGLPASAAYVLVAITIAPTLIRLGIGVLPAHLFVFFFANFSFITPPVAIAALFGSQLAGGNYVKTAIQASLVGMAGFIVPFIIIFSPAFMFDFSEPFFAITSLIACPIIFFGLQSSTVGYFTKRLNLVERAIILLSPIALLLHIYTTNFIWFAVGLAILATFVVWQRRITRRERQNLNIERVTD